MVIPFRFNSENKVNMPSKKIRKKSQQGEIEFFYKCYQEVVENEVVRTLYLISSETNLKDSNIEEK